MRKTAAIMAFSLIAASPAPPVQPRLANGNFSRGTAGWVLDEEAAKDGYRFSVAAGRARVSATDPKTGSLGVVRQDVSAVPYRGGYVELTGRARVRGKGAATLRLGAMHKATLTESERRVLRAYSADAAVPADGKWHRVAVRGRVVRDADTLMTFVALNGPGVAEFDDLTLRRAEAPSGPMSPVASAALDKALGYIHELHINAKNNPDWPAMAAQAKRDAAGARTIDDLSPALTALLGDLKEHHAFLLSPDFRQQNSASQADASALRPSVSLVDDRFGLVVIPGFNMNGEADVPLAKSYIATVRSGLAQLDAKPLCGWIVDLRENTGGTTHVMAEAVAGVSGADPTKWPDEYGAPGQDLSELPEAFRWLMKPTPQALSQGSKPVAVLFGEKTGSAGEDTALRFQGRPLTRTFGQSSAGYTSGNETREIGGGWMIAIPSGYMHDRNGVPAKDKLVPDVVTDDPMTAAKSWLNGQCH